jgi:hypothetical protein
LSALLTGNISAAIAYNPGVVVAVAFLLAINVYAVAVLVFRLSPWRPYFPRWRWGVFVAVLLNWVYLLLAGTV